MVSRSCLDCGAVTKATRCPDCTSVRNIARGSSTRRGYDSKWRRLSKRIRKARPVCEIRLPGCTFLADATDHVIPLEDGGRSTPDNARPACTPCNNRRRYMEPLE